MFSLFNFDFLFSGYLSLLILSPRLRMIFVRKKRIFSPDTWGTIFSCTLMLVLFYTQVVLNWAQNLNEKEQSCDYRFLGAIFPPFQSLSKPRFINILTAFLRMHWSACVAVTIYYRIEFYFLTTLKAGRSPSISKLGFWWKCSSWLSCGWLPSCYALVAFSWGCKWRES